MKRTKHSMWPVPVAETIEDVVELGQVEVTEVAKILRQL